jgi:hypothetical protein
MRHAILVEPRSSTPKGPERMFLARNVSSGGGRTVCSSTGCRRDMLFMMVRLRKNFFFEKKKQKTFAPSEPGFGNTSGPDSQKFFWFFFYKKRTSYFLS